jgi:SAM-dependent methyltransferase
LLFALVNPQTHLHHEQNAPTNMPLSLPLMEVMQLELIALELVQNTNQQLTLSPESHRVAASQTKHRLLLLKAWCGDHSSLTSKTVLEIGCGQGDMTVALAWAVGPSGTIHAIDPAPLDYGSPETLGAAQGRISSSVFGMRIKWKQSDPLEAIRADPSLLAAADYVVLAHSLLYMRSSEYIAALFQVLRDGMSMSVVRTERQPKLLIAEWGMKVSDERARAHLLAVQAQAAQPLPSGNVQLYIEPKETLELARSAGWSKENEVWIDSPGLDDGEWEVAAARSMPTASDDIAEAAGTFLDQLESAAISGPVKCMDVWTCVLH